MTRIKKLALALSTISVAALIVACTGDTRVPEDRSEAAAEVSEMQREARAEMKQQLDALERRLAELRQEADQAGDKVENTWNESVADLERKTTELRREWEQMEDKSEDAWDAFSERARRAIAEIESGLKAAADEIG